VKTETTASNNIKTPRIYLTTSGLNSNFFPFHSAQRYKDLLLYLTTPQLLQ